MQCSHLFNTLLVCNPGYKLKIQSHYILFQSGALCHRFWLGPWTFWDIWFEFDMGRIIAYLVSIPFFFFFSNSVFIITHLNQIHYAENIWFIYYMCEKAKCTCTCYGTLLRKMIKKISQYTQCTCSFCGKIRMKRKTCWHLALCSVWKIQRELLGHTTPHWLPELRLPSRDWRRWRTLILYRLKLSCLRFCLFFYMAYWNILQ